MQIKKVKKNCFVISKDEFFWWDKLDGHFDFHSVKPLSRFCFGRKIFAFIYLIFNKKYIKSQSFYLK